MVLLDPGTTVRPVPPGVLACSADAAAWVVPVSLAAGTQAAGPAIKAASSRTVRDGVAMSRVPFVYQPVERLILPSTGGRLVSPWIRAQAPHHARMSTGMHAD
jgi:hypothetical protein